MEFDGNNLYVGSGFIKRPGRLAYRFLLREQMKSGENVIVENEQSEVLKGKIMFGYLDKEGNFNDVRYPTKTNKGEGTPGYFIVGKNKVMKIPLCKIANAEFSSGPLEIKVNNNLPPKGQRSYMGWLE